MAQLSYLQWKLILSAFASAYIKDIMRICRRVFAYILVVRQLAQVHTYAMDELRGALALLNGLGYEFMVFIREKDHLRSESIENNFFSESFISSSFGRNPPLTFYPQVNRKTMTVYETNYQPTIIIPLDQPILMQDYLYAAFKLLRQVPCKAIAKLWIKIIEPRKKTRFPYIKGDAKKPAWWPKEVEHKEPDHLHKADRLKLMCTIIMNVLPQLPSKLEILDELVRLTVSMTILKREKVKRVVMKNVFEIAKCLCDRDSKREIITLDDINDLAKKHKESYYRHRSNVDETTTMREKFSHVSDRDNSSCSRFPSMKENRTEYLSREHSKYLESDSVSRLEKVVDFDPLLLTRLDELSSSDSLDSSDDPRYFA